MKFTHLQIIFIISSLAALAVISYLSTYSVSVRTY